MTLKKMKTLATFLILIFAVIIFNIVAIVGFIVQIPRKVLRKESLREYFLILAIGEDQRDGSYLYGTEDYTISSYTYYLHNRGNIYATYFMHFIDFFGFLLGDGKEHCKKSYEKEVKELKNGGATFSTKSKKER